MQPPPPYRDQRGYIIRIFICIKRPCCKCNTNNAARKCMKNNDNESKLGFPLGVTLRREFSQQITLLQMTYAYMGVLFRAKNYGLAENLCFERFIINFFFWRSFRNP